MNKFTTLAAGAHARRRLASARFAQAPHRADAAHRPARGEPAGAHRGRRRQRPAQPPRSAPARARAGADPRRRAAGQGRRRRHAARAPPARAHAAPGRARTSAPRCTTTQSRTAVEPASATAPARPSDGASPLQRQRARVQRVARRAGDLGGERDRLLQRQRAPAAGAARASCARRPSSAAAAGASACSTSTNSPRARFASAASQAGSVARPAASTTVSNCLVSSRHSVTRALAAGRGQRRGQRLDAVRRLEQHLRRAAARQRLQRRVALGAAWPAGSRRRRSRSRRASPATLSAASALLAPGHRHARGGRPRAPRRPARAPGSLTAGVPASLT